MPWVLRVVATHLDDTQQVHDGGSLAKTVRRSGHPSGAPTMTEAT
jgi:hypothetical protein